MKASDASTIRLRAADNVVVAVRDLPPGLRIEEEGLVVQNEIRTGHKVATREIPFGEPVRKYGQVIGVASRTIRTGEHVHTHNVEMSPSSREYDVGCDAKATELLPQRDQAVFEGIVRENGRVATRNYIGVLPSVACAATVCRYIAEQFDADRLRPFPNIDGVVGLTQTSGCGMAPSGEGFENLQRSLAGYARHPNFWGVLLVGLGCEVNQIESMVENMHLTRVPRLRTMSIQDTGGTEATVNRAVEMIQEMLPEAHAVQRQPVSASNLILGLECGGSDAYSGITANPALGFAVDLLIRNGGTAVLGETTEIYGAEHLLVRRAARPEVGRKLIRLIQWWEGYARRNGAEINNNPTPGNKAGGLTTILEKSLGAVAKGGTTNLVEVYRYAEPVEAKGFVFMDTPGYDLASITGMIAGGANVLCFTTGCGTVLGCKPTPVIKLASNTPMYRKLLGDMDVNCGVVADGEASVADTGKLIFQEILDTASGKKTKSERFGYGDNEFVPWQIGAVL